MVITTRGIILLLLIVQTKQQASENSRELDKFVGHWKVRTQTNTQGYLKAIGVATPKSWFAAKFVTPEMFITRIDGGLSVKVCGGSCSKPVNFRFNGKEYDSITADGRSAKVINQLEGGKWVSAMKWMEKNGGAKKNGKNIFHIANNGQLVAKLQVGEVISEQRLNKV